MASKTRSRLLLSLLFPLAIICVQVFARQNIDTTTYAVAKMSVTEIEEAVLVRSIILLKRILSFD